MNGWALRLPTPGGTRPSFKASDRGQKHFFASKIVLRIIVCCFCGVSSTSSSRRMPRFIVLFSSGHRWLFFLASLWAYVVVASFLCLRVVGSSFRRLRYRDLGRYLMYGDIYCTVTLLPCYLVTLLLCYLVTLLLVTLLPCYPVTYTSYPVTLLPCYLVTLLSGYLVTLLPCYFVTLLLRYLVTITPCYSVTLSHRYLVTLLPCHSVTCCSVPLLPCYLVALCLIALSSCYSLPLLPVTLLSITSRLSSVLNSILDHHMPGFLHLPH